MAVGPKYSYDLPNDLRVLDAAGARTGTYENIIKLDYDREYQPIADAVLAKEDRAALRFEDIRDEIMFVRILDPLGPQFVTGTKQPIADTLGTNGTVAAQIRSMLLSLWGHRYLIEHDYLNRRDATSLYSAFFIPGAVAHPPCLEGPRSQASIYVLNHLLEAGALAVGADGRFTINRTAADAEITRAAREFISAMAAGDSAAIRSLLERYAVMTPVIRDLLPRLGPELPLLRVVYSTAARLSPPTR